MDSQDYYPTQDELNDLELACQRLWEIDDNRLEPEVHYSIDPQRGKNFHNGKDVAADSFFKGVNRKAFMKFPTFRTFFALLDNYEPHTGVAEEVTKEEKRENWDFLNAVYETRPIKYLHQYLLEKGLFDSEDPREFKSMLYKTWFYLIRRDTNSDSSPFEHVFVGEFRHGQVIGFHNWVYLFLEEKAGRLDYKGFVYPKRRLDHPVDGTERVISLNFSWEGLEKKVTTCFIGVSPEFEMALYTLCFFVGQEDNYIHLDGYDLNIKCYRMGRKLGSAFPEMQ
eukprot:TRINITY_DN1873_c0_g1_i1.p1 TRINITY_DN1873_c0_g1~~TRINITY_DN1873_c0_g1_i1.p1  ORF type:complete len:281 (-),score=70.90 TRINITY_DN1873_c0_g1_i1:52-894(-)